MSSRRAGESPTGVSGSAVESSGPTRLGSGIAIALWLIALVAGLTLLPRLESVSVTDPALFLKGRRLGCDRAA